MKIEIEVSEELVREEIQRQAAKMVLRSRWWLGLTRSTALMR